MSTKNYTKDEILKGLRKQRTGVGKVVRARKDRYGYEVTYQVKKGWNDPRDSDEVRTFIYFDVIEQAINEDTVSGGKGDGKSVSDIATKHGVSPEQIKDELKKGIEVEMEHTSSPKISAEIALDHLCEDPRYYTKLSTIHKENTMKESTEPVIITQLRDVMKNGYKTLKDPKSGRKMKVDSYSASAIVKVYDALNDTNKEKFSTLGLLGMQSVSFKVLK